MISDYEPRPSIYRLIWGGAGVVFGLIGFALSLWGLYATESLWRLSWILGLAGGIMYMRDGLDQMVGRIHITGHSVRRRMAFGTWLQYDCSQVVDVSLLDPKHLQLKFDDGVKIQVYDSEMVLRDVMTMLNSGETES